MATLNITTPERHGQYYTTTLDGRDFDFAWSWNQRSSRWWVKISDADGMIVYIPAVTGYPLLKSVTGIRRPPGELMVVDPTEENREPSLRNFADFDLLYVEEDDIPEGY